jgi:hypothetical protein
LRSRLEYGLASLLGAPTVSVIALAAGCLPDCETARGSLRLLATGAVPPLLPGIVPGSEKDTN